SPFPWRDAPPADTLARIARIGMFRLDRLTESTASGRHDSTPYCSGRAEDDPAVAHPATAPARSGGAGRGGRPAGDPGRRGGRPLAGAPRRAALGADAARPTGGAVLPGRRRE